jgi:large conductance mechanosensitive channel
VLHRRGGGTPCAPGICVKGMIMLQEFKEFIARGNVMDMAVGIIIGAAFTAIVGSLVSDLINPIISLFLGGIDFSGLYLLLGSGEYASIAAAEEAGAAVFAYGRFIMAVINFLIIAWVVFLLVKAVNRVSAAASRPEPEPAPAEPAPTELDILMEIRDALKK